MDESRFSLPPKFLSTQPTVNQHLSDFVVLDAFAVVMANVISIRQVKLSALSKLTMGQEPDQKRQDNLKYLRKWEDFREKRLELVDKYIFLRKRQSIALEFIK